MTGILLAILIVLPELISYAYMVADRNNIDGNMLVAQISAESKWNVKAKSPAGAIGIAQIVPKFHPTVNPYDPYDSIDYLGEKLGQYLDKYGSWELALAAWNAGEPTVDRCWCIPWSETRGYVYHITSRAGTRPVEIE